MYSVLASGANSADESQVSGLTAPNTYTHSYSLW
jgi:hypothetical protein